ncbi:hypothetical protein DPMN_124621 [Dreissena polymorpha]|uniref:Major facilitator superfamily (MFS) profile domain-containing protein n=1 Tax=Dreissena polymorpha TaxID=45954 RepID=A0A9D4JSB9_DREPO|nr:hypothetical protein DPMN_124621 [Dreissena polymorpha]
MFDGVSRVFVGLHNGVTVSLASLYLAEISPKKIRGAIGTCHQLFITIGILVVSDNRPSRSPS